MKILHISDLHLGKIVNGFSMLSDQQHILNQVINIIDESNIDVLVIAGDIYDRAIPSALAVEEFSNFLLQCSKSNAEVLIINGNHDSLKRLGFASELLRSNHIHIVSKNSLFQKIKIDDVNFYLLPFISLEQASILLNQKISDYNTLKANIISEIEIDDNQVNILVDHSYIINEGSSTMTSSSERPLALGTCEFTNSNVYQAFDLVLAGHIHRHAHLKPNIYYSGSILPYSIGERNNKNGYYIHTVENNIINSKYYHFDLLHKVRYIELYIDEINTHTYSEDYVAVKLLDEGQIINPIEKVRTKYPNVMQIDRVFSAIEMTENSSNLLDSLEDSFTEFYNLNSEDEINPDSIQAFLEIANQVQKGDDDDTD